MLRTGTGNSRIIMLKTRKVSNSVLPGYLGEFDLQGEVQGAQTT